MKEQTKLSVDLIISNKNQKCNFVKKKSYYKVEGKVSSAHALKM